MPAKKKIETQEGRQAADAVASATAPDSTKAATAADAVASAIAPDAAVNADAVASDPAASATVPGSAANAFEPVAPRGRMVFSMLGGGTSPFERSLAAARSSGGITARGADGGAMSGRGKAAASKGGMAASAPSNNGQGGAFAGMFADTDSTTGAEADDFAEAPTPAGYSPFSSADGEGGEDAWSHSLAQIEGESEFISHPEDEEESGYGGNSLAMASLAGTAAAAKALASAADPDRPAQIYGENSPQFNAALEKISERSREALEVLLRAQFRHLEQ